MRSGLISRPVPPPAIATQPTQFAGRSAIDKMKDMQKAIAGHDAVVLTQPDSVAWLFNLRGLDVPLHTRRCPPMPSFMPRARRKSSSHRKLTEDVKPHLKKIAITRKPAEIKASLKALGKDKARVLVDAAWTPERIREMLAKSRVSIATVTIPDLAQGPQEHRRTGRCPHRPAP